MRSFVDGLRTEDEDLDKSLRALRPVRRGGHIGDADKRTKQIEWVEIGTYVAVGDSSFHERMNGSPDFGSRCFKQPALCVSGPPTA